MPLKKMFKDLLLMLRFDIKGGRGSVRQRKYSPQAPVVVSAEKIIVHAYENVHSLIMDIQKANAFKENSQQQKRKSTGIFQFVQRFCLLCALPPIRISSELSVGKDALGKYICRSFYFATEPNFKIMFSYEEYAGQISQKFKRPDFFGLN